MKTKHLLILHHLFGQPDYIKCTRGKLSTIKYGFRHLKKGNCLYFTVKKLV
jgi:hypothetical protein